MCILGSDMAVLSAAPLRCPLLQYEETVPFTKFLMHQHGESVQCVPFSTSPFSVLDVASSYPPSHSIMINEDLSINPSSVKTNLVNLLSIPFLMLVISFNTTDIRLPNLITSISGSIRNTRRKRQHQSIHFYSPGS